MFYYYFFFHVTQLLTLEIQAENLASLHKHQFKQKKKLLIRHHIICIILQTDESNFFLPPLSFSFIRQSCLESYDLCHNPSTRVEKRVEFSNNIPKRGAQYSPQGSLCNHYFFFFFFLFYF